MTLTAFPSAGCSFEKWSGDIGDNEVGNISINVVMDTDRTITADFTGCPGPHNITISYSTYSSGGDTINASFGSLTWSADRTTSGTTVNVTAVAAKGYRFDGWQGAINGSQETMSFLADSSEPVTAQFSSTSSSPLPYAIIGIAAILLVLAGILIYRFKFGRTKRPKDSPINASSPPQPPQPQGEQAAQ